jgi:hypothetical protein
MLGGVEMGRMEWAELFERAEAYELENDDVTEALAAVRDDDE